MFARTERLLLRPGWAEDATAVHAALADEAVVTMLARAPWPYRLEDAQAFLARPASARFPTMLAFARGDAAPRLVGCVGLTREDGEAELGYWIARAEWGCGYATEAGAAVLDMARAVGHARVVAGHFVDNPRSARVLAKLGFVPSGCVAARPACARGRLVPTMLMTRTLAQGGEAQPMAA